MPYKDMPKTKAKFSLIIIFLIVFIVGGSFLFKNFDSVSDKLEAFKSDFSIREKFAELFDRKKDKYEKDPDEEDFLVAENNENEADEGEVEVIKAIDTNEEDKETVAVADEPKITKEAAATSSTQTTQTMSSSSSNSINKSPSSGLPFEAMLAISISFGGLAVFAFLFSEINKEHNRKYQAQV